MAALGLSESDFEPERLEVWPDVVDAFLVFLDMRTQWRFGARGATGLDYRVLFDIFDMRGIEAKDRSHLFDDIRFMELEALNIIRSA